MEYKTKGKEETNVKRQKRESESARVNNKRGDGSKTPGKEKNDKADDISNNFPNFSVLNKEEKLAFFEALSAARKNIESRGLPTRERFGTVHDEYLKYFAQDDKGEDVKKKPESAPSTKPNRSPVARDSRSVTPKSPKERVLKSPKQVSPMLKRASKLPLKNPLRPESEPIDKCEAVIQRDTEKMIQMYLNKKRRIEEQWKRASQTSRSPPAKAPPHKSPGPKKKEPSRPESAKAVRTAPDSKIKTPSKAVDTPQFQALNPTEQKEFFKILKEAHNNVLQKNPDKKSRIPTLDEVLKPYRSSGNKVTTVCTATKDCHRTREPHKNLRVKVTLTSADRARINRSKSQTLCDMINEEPDGRSKSLENMQSSDTVHEIPRKIPSIRKPLQEKNECDDDFDKPVKEIPKEIVKEETLVIEKKPEEKKEILPFKKCNENAKYKKFGMIKLKKLKFDKRKAECKKTQKEPEPPKQEKELLKKKSKEDLRIYEEPLAECLAPVLEDTTAKKCAPLVLTGLSKKITGEECVEKIPDKCAKEVQKENVKRKDFEEGKESTRTGNETHEETCRERADDEDERNQSSEEYASSSSKESEKSVSGRSSSESQSDISEEYQRTSDAAKTKSKPLDSSPSPDRRGNEQVVKTATQSSKSLAGMSFVEERPGEVWKSQERVPTFTTGKVVVVDDNVIRKIKNLIQYLEKKVNPRDNLESEYVSLVLSYTEYLTKMAESLVLRKATAGQKVHSTYAAHDVHLKFKDNKSDKFGGNDHIPRSISDHELHKQILAGPSGTEKKPKDQSEPRQSSLDYMISSDSDSSFDSEHEVHTLIPLAFKKPGVPVSKIRLLQDLLKGRAKFVEGSIDDLKIIHCPEKEYVPPEKSSAEQPKELKDEDVEHEKVNRMKFLKKLIKLCNCGRKQIEEDAILENLKGEAVRVDTTEGKKDPTSATINQSTMEVLKAAERKKIIEKYLNKDQS